MICYCVWRYYRLYRVDVDSPYCFHFAACLFRVYLHIDRKAINDSSFDMNTFIETCIPNNISKHY